MDCYACEQPAINACKRCAKPYCEDHGNAQYCAECLTPASAMPSFNLYRGALLVMLFGTAIAVFLLVRPPGESNGAPQVNVGRSTATTTPAGGTPRPTVAAETPRATATRAITATPTESPFIEYTIQSGDTLFDIAEANLAPGDDLTAFAEAIANLNGIDIESPILTPGDTLLLPRTSP